MHGSFGRVKLKAFFAQRSLEQRQATTALDAANAPGGVEQADRSPAPVSFPDRGKERRREDRIRLPPRSGKAQTTRPRPELDYGRATQTADAALGRPRPQRQARAEAGTFALDQKRAGQAIDFILMDRPRHATVKPLTIPDILAAMA